MDKVDEILKRLQQIMEYRYEEISKLDLNDSKNFYRAFAMRM